MNFTRQKLYSHEITNFITEKPSGSTIPLCLPLCTKPPKLSSLLTRSPYPNPPLGQSKVRCWLLSFGDGERRGWEQRGGGASRALCAPVRARNWRETARSGSATEACGRRRGGSVRQCSSAFGTMVEWSGSCLGVWWSSGRGQLEPGKAGRWSPTVDRTRRRQEGSGSSSRGQGKALGTQLAGQGAS
jgi:hypothetical protein